MDRVIVRGLVLQATVGVTAAERSAPQRVRLDLDLAVDLDQAAEADDLARTIDYAAVVETLRAVAAAERTKLLETLAARMATALFDRFGPDRIGHTPPPGKALAVRLRLVKLAPPVEGEVDRIGIEIERTATPRRAAPPGPVGFR